MNTLVLLQITAPLCLLFAVKRKMYYSNLVGFVVILSVCIFLVASHFLQDWEQKHYALLALLLLWISTYNTYKKYKKRRKLI